MISRLRLIIVLLLVVVLTLVCLPFQALAAALDLKFARKIPLFWHRLVCALIGIKVTTIGSLNRERPLLLVSNHISWCDILILGSVAEVCFIAKNEVAKIPFAGLLAKLQRSVFVVREEKQRSADQALEITNRILSGDVMVLFAEGTTGDGNYILDFKSSLFGAAQYALKQGDCERVIIQPVSIAYTKFQGMVMGRRQRARASWPGDVGLFSHAGPFIRSSAWDVEVTFCKPIAFEENTRRREIASKSQSSVTKAYQRSIFRNDR